MKTETKFTINFRGALLDITVYNEDCIEFDAFYLGENGANGGIKVNGLFFDMKLTYELATAVQVGFSEHQMESAQQAVELAREYSQDKAA